MFARSTHEVCLIHDKLMGVSLQVFNKSRNIGTSLSDDARSTVISKVQEQYPELEVKPKQIVDTVRGQLHDGRLGVVAMGEGQGANKGECRTTIHHLCHHSTLTMYISFISFCTFAFHLLLSDFLESAEYSNA